MSRWAVAASRAVLIALGLGTLAAQVLLPAFAHETGRMYPDVAHLVLPYAVIAVGAVVGPQVCLIGVWRLLSMSAKGHVFERRALRWLTICRVALGGSAALVSLALAHLLFIERLGGPGVLLALVASVSTGVAAYLFIGVSRGVLQVAIGQHDELAEVV